jgi:hypothetical protein
MVDITWLVFAGVREINSRFVISEPSHYLESNGDGSKVVDGVCKFFFVANCDVD